MPTLHLSRIRTIAIETFKCLYQLSPLYLHDLVHFKSSSRSFRYSNMLEVPTVRTTTYGKQSFRFEATHIWNSLPNHVRQVDNYKEFVRLVRIWEGQTCRCAMCS